MDQVIKNVFTGYPLPSDHSSELNAYLSKPTDEYKKKYTDGVVYKAITDLMKCSPYDNDELLSLLAKAKADERITKQFDKPLAQYENIQEFFVPERPDFRWNRSYQTARTWLLKWVMPSLSRTLRPLNIRVKSDVDRAFSNMNASCGAMSPRSKKKERMKEIVNLASYLLENPQYRGLPALCFKRSQISGFIEKGELSGATIKEKLRLVWAVDAATVLLEARFARPLMDSVLPRMINYAGGKNDDEIRNVLMAWWEDTTDWICFDYTQYDATVPSWLIRDMFDLIKIYFPKESHSDIDWLCQEFIETKIIMPKGDVMAKKKGIPSGSYFTQLIGTLCNLQTMLCAIIAVHGESEARNMLLRSNGFLSLMAMGDDNVVFSRGKIDVKSVISYIGRNFGLAINDDKCDKGNTIQAPVFLKRKWYPEGAWRDIKELLVQMTHPEFWRTYQNYSPYHIIYGYMITYPLAFENVIDRNEVILRMGDSDGGINALRNIRQQDLPGSLRYLAISNPNAYGRMVKAAESAYRKLASKRRSA